jgi:hypothetical protein
LVFDIYLFRFKGWWSGSSVARLSSKSEALSTNTSSAKKKKNYILLLFFTFETGFCCVVQVGLGLVILLPQPPEYWDYRCAPLCPLFFDIKSAADMAEVEEPKK